MKNLTAIIGWILLVSGLTVYVYGISYAIFFPIEVQEKSTTILKIPETLETFTTSVGAILLTNLGAVLGISVVAPNAPIARIALSPAAFATVPTPISMREKIQVVAILIYVISLMACTLAWGVATFKAHPAPVAALIPQYGKTFIGVITAYLAFTLAINQNNHVTSKLTS